MSRPAERRHRKNETQLKSNELDKRLMMIKIDHQKAMTMEPRLSKTGDNLLPEQLPVQNTTNSVPNPQWNTTPPYLSTVSVFDQFVTPTTHLGQYHSEATPLSRLSHIPEWFDPTLVTVAVENLIITHPGIEENSTGVAQPVVDISFDEILCQSYAMTFSGTAPEDLEFDALREKLAEME